MQWLDWPDCANVRDLAGTPTSDGRVVPDRTLVRSGEHSTLTAAGQSAFRSYGISRVIDLRGLDECSARPSPFAGEPWYSSHPVQAAIGDADSLLDLYFLLLKRSATTFAGAVAAIASAPPGAVVVHCHAGKDRSGLVVALALSAAGVPNDQIVADYALTETDVRSIALNEVLLAKLTDRTRRADIEDWLGSRPETMVRTLEHLDSTYGGVEAYLRGPGGLNDDHLTRLRDRLAPAVVSE
ncbi:tyrosine-protein phosphatase [Flindersiella endophytica]